MSKAIEIEASPRVAVVAIVAGAILFAILFVSAGWSDRERARLSTECIKAGGDWLGAACRRKP